MLQFYPDQNGDGAKILNKKKIGKKKPKWKAVNILNAAAAEAEKIVCDKKLKNK